MGKELNYMKKAAGIEILLSDSSFWQLNANSLSIQWIISLKI